MRSFTFAIPGDLNLPTGGYAYARRLLAEWPEQNVEAEVLQLPASFPHPTKLDLAKLPTLFGSAKQPFLVDGLAYGALERSIAEDVGRFGVALVHHPLCDEQGLDDETRARLFDTERIALSFAAGVVATSPSTARDLVARFDVPEDRITVAIPGTDHAPRAPLQGNIPRILAVGAVTPRKGYSVLVEALASLSHLPWHCDIHGATDRHPSEATRLRKQIAAANLQDRVTLLGATSDEAIAAAYLSADLFVAPSLHEGYGMAVVEAMARGLPVVITTAGALQETAPCAAHCHPDSASSLTDAMRPLIDSKLKRAELGDTCRTFAQTLPSWADTARRVAQAVEQI